MSNHRLLRHLQGQFTCPQPSERWAMYRVIVPVVDAANIVLGFEVYFEYKQVSGHGTTQSADVALLDQGKARVMVEAKRVGRSVSVEQIEKYLTPNVRGVVSNGVSWVLCVDGKSKVVAIWDNSARRVVEENVDYVLRFMRGEISATADWNETPHNVHAVLRPERHDNTNGATRVSKPVTRVTSLTELDQAVEQLTNTTAPDAAFLQGVHDGLKRNGQLPKHLHIEVRDSRVVFRDSRIKSGSKRVSRIELGKRNPDILVLTKVVDTHPSLSNLVASVVHDKGPHMRRFRLQSEAQSRQFGELLGDAMAE